MKNLLESIKTFYRILMLNILSFLIPRQGRRAIFLIHVFFEIAKISPEHTKLIKELNKQLKLTSDEGVLEGTILLAYKLANDHRLMVRDIRPDMSEEEIFGMCNRILSKRHRWANYNDNYNVIYKETSTVIKKALQCQSMENTHETT